MFVKSRLTNGVVHPDLKQDSELTEQVMADGIQYRQINMTLYIVHNGNTRMQAINGDQF